MSATLLTRVKDHISSVLTGYSVRYYKWTDADLNGGGGVVLFRMSGTGETGTAITQAGDVSIFILADPSAVKAADDKMQAIVSYIRTNYKDTDIHNIEPMGPFTGPTYLANGRALFELRVRCRTTDQ